MPRMMLPALESVLSALTDTQRRVLIEQAEQMDPEPEAAWFKALLCAISMEVMLDRMNEDQLFKRLEEQE